MNLVNLWFPKQEQPSEDVVIDNICFVMHYYGMTKAEFDELYIPEYIILRDYAFKKIKEENDIWSKTFSKFRGR